MNEPTHLDLFSGIGGFALAAGWAGFQTIGFSEIDPYCSAVLKKHWPGVTNYGDVRTVPAIGCDLLTGGFPCQPFSCAGKRRGAKDDRHLWPAMLEVIRRCGPTWVVGENVPGIIGMALDDLCADLEAADYEVQPFVIPACAVDARHERERLWVVANASAGRRNCQKARENKQPRRAETECPSETFPNVNKSRLPKRCESQLLVQQPATIGSCGWTPEPDVDRVAHGVPARVDRLRALGNAIVPQTVYPILKAIHDLITSPDLRSHHPMLR